MKNVNIYPATKHVEANDKLAEFVFYFPDDLHKTLITTQKKTGFVEKPKHKKMGDIITTVGLSLINEYTDTKPLNQYDRSVLAACISEWEVGNRYTTPNIIYRHLTGKTKSTDTPEPAQIDAILESIRKLMSLVISINMSDSCENFGYNNGKPFQITSSVLPAMYKNDFTVNGQYTTVIYFDRESPILTVARIKKQLLTYDLKLLNVPKQHNSVDAIAVKNYVLHRVQEIKLHKMTATITFDDVFEKCRLTETDNKKKLRLRKIILELMDHLKNNGAILNYEVQKRGNKFQSIAFNYKSKSK